LAWANTLGADHVDVAPEPTPQQLAENAWRREQYLAGRDVDGSEASQQVSVSRIVAEARELRSVNRENPEYDRALVDLTCRLLGLTDGGESQVRYLLFEKPHYL
jgi:hypothetical protein